MNSRLREKDKIIFPRPMYILEYSCIKEISNYFLMQTTSCHEQTELHMAG
jgi:hypothetical protein